MRPFLRADAAEAFAVFGEPVVMRYAAGAADPTPAATHARIERYIEHQDRHGFSKWVVRDASSGEYLGDSGISDRRNTASIRVLEKIHMPFERLDHLCGMDCVVHAIARPPGDQG